jgi:hypothetical protein
MIALVTAIALFVAFSYTPTITVRVLNNTSQQLTISVCGSDPETLSPGQSTDIDPNPNDPNAACVVYHGNTGVELGCLYIPTTRIHNGATVELSHMTPGVPAGKCGD